MALKATTPSALTQLVKMIESLRRPENVIAPRQCKLILENSCLLP
jgi:hypothetical protein